MKNTISNTNTTIELWKHDLLGKLTDIGINIIEVHHNKYSLFQAHHLILNLIDLENHYQPKDFLALQKEQAQKGNKLIHLWEDVWSTKSDQVIARLKSILGYNTRIHGRQTKVERLSKPIAESFINSNHLQGYVTSRFKFGLLFKDELVAVATFSSLRKMNHTDHYKSAELIRFAVKAGYSVSGGLSKLISAFKSNQNPNDLMTYADRDWSAGEAYRKLGFEIESSLEPQFYFLNHLQLRQLKKDVNTVIDSRIFNTGSLKYILKF